MVGLGLWVSCSEVILWPSFFFQLASALHVDNNKSRHAGGHSVQPGLDERDIGYQGALYEDREILVSTVPSTFLFFAFFSFFAACCVLFALVCFAFCSFSGFKRQRCTTPVLIAVRSFYLHTSTRRKPSTAVLFSHTPRLINIIRLHLPQLCT